MSRASSSSLISANPSESLRRPLRPLFRLPGLPNSWRASSASISCPQIPPLNFEDETTVYFRSHTLTVEPSVPPSPRSSVFSGHNSTWSYNGAFLGHTPLTSQTFTASISDASGTLSPLEVALHTRESMWLSGGNPRVIRKATMEGLVQYLLLNPAGESSDSSEHCDIIYELIDYRQRYGPTRYFFHGTPSCYFTMGCPRDFNPPF